MCAGGTLTLCMYSYSCIALAILPLHAPGPSKFVMIFFGWFRFVNREVIVYGIQKVTDKGSARTRTWQSDTLDSLLYEVGV